MTLTRTNTHAVKGAAFGAAALALLSLSLARPATAAPLAGSVPVFGSVDITKLSAGSTRKAKYDAALHALEDKLTSAIQQQAKYTMLSSTDQTQLGALLNIPRPTDADRAQITALETKAAANEQQLTTLQQKTSPTPADTAQLGALTDMNAASQTVLKTIADGYQAQLRKLSDEDNVAFTQIVKDAIAASAKERGLTMVFTSDVAVYTTNDITEDVIKRINK